MAIQDLVAMAIRGVTMASLVASININSMAVNLISRDTMAGTLILVDMVDMMAPLPDMAPEIMEIEGTEVVDVDEISVIVLEEGGVMVTIIRVDEVAVAAALGGGDVGEGARAVNRVPTFLVYPRF
jgi:hypothetical protein